MSAPTPTIASLKAADDEKTRSRMNWVTWLSLGATRTVEEAEAHCLREHAKILAEKKAQDETTLSTLKKPVPAISVCKLRGEWHKREIEFNTIKVQEQINKLIFWILAYDGKERIMENLTNAIKSATEKRDMKVKILSYHCDDTVKLNDEDESTSLTINWIVKNTSFLQQLAACFGPFFKVRHTLFFNQETETFVPTLILEFWPYP
jgi:hypothetical protein